MSTDMLMYEYMYCFSLYEKEAVKNWQSNNVKMPYVKSLLDRYEFSIFENQYQSVTWRTKLHFESKIVQDSTKISDLLHYQHQVSMFIMQFN